MFNNNNKQKRLSLLNFLRAAILFHTKEPLLPNNSDNAVTS